MTLIEKIEKGFQINSLMRRQILVALCDQRKMKEALELIRDIASGSTTANSLPHILKIAEEALNGKG